MIAIDTNIVVRFLVRDDEEQAQRARRLLAGESVHIPKTVLLETEWVLRYAYELDREAVCGALEQLCRMSGVQVEDAPRVRQALLWLREGLDFADALHLASSPENVPFYSFDRDLQRRAGSAGAPAVEAP